MPTFTAPPDSRYYQNILQHDDGTYTADQKPLNDTITTRMNPANFSSPITVIIYGLRSVVRDTMINPATSAYIYKYAPDWAQRNATQTIQTLSAKTPPLTPTETQALADAKAMWTWINNVVAYSNSLTTAVQAMTFEQIVVYVVPSTGWPAPPASLIPEPTGLAT
jgi:hypothetical protein